MSDKACGARGKQCHLNKMMQENTDSEYFYQKYTLSEEAAARIESIKKMMIQDNNIEANPLWKVIAGENEEKISSTSEESDDDVEPNNSKSQTHDQSMLQPSTQFYFTQSERTIESERPVAALSQRCDILESACENLERNNGSLDFTQLVNLSDEDLIPFVDEMVGKLSTKGIYNLCQSMNNMTIEQNMKYLSIFCTHLLLPKIMELEEPSRLLLSAIGDCTKKFPNEVQQFIFIPLLNAELKDTALITTIVNTFDPQKKTVLLEEFLTYVKELKSWHISILQNFLSAKLDHSMIDKIIKLFLGKALCYSKDKNFGKLVLSFLKINTTLSEEQKRLMNEVVSINETLFKKPMKSILENM